MSLHTLIGGNIMGEDIINGGTEDKKQKGITWSRIANKESVKIMILLQKNGSATLDEISKKRQKDNKIILLKLKGLMYYGLIEKEDDKYILNEKGEKVLNLLFELIEMVKAETEFRPLKNKREKIKN
jgi:DNA-binding HxlR family transcriptional regulator